MTPAVFPPAHRRAPLRRVVRWRPLLAVADAAVDDDIPRDIATMPDHSFEAWARKVGKR